MLVNLHIYTEETGSVPLSFEFQSCSSYWLAHFQDLQRSSVQIQEMYQPMGKWELYSAVN
jgi:hypothetical protein